MRFTKMHGLGNDYVYVDGFTQSIHHPEALARAISDRHRGVGSDGLIIVAPARQGDVRMIIYNADGSRAEMCGNGIRCLARYAWERGLVRRNPIRVETDAGLRTCELLFHDGRITAVRVDMGPVSFHPADLPARFDGPQILDHPIDAAGRSWNITCASLGNPHAVVFVSDPDTVPLARVGPAIEHHPLFPQRINVHFVRAEAPDRLIVRTWERGSGPTQACGTGACAALAAAWITRRCQPHALVRLPGGELDVQLDTEADPPRAWLTGPAEFVFEGDWPEPPGGV